MTRNPDVTPLDDTALGVNRTASAQAARAARALQASGRRRFVDPTTCDRDDSAAEAEFMAAMQAYRLASGRMFPTWSEVLEVLTGLGYVKARRDDDGLTAGASGPPASSRT
jgi:hypothetical protein